MSKHFSYTKEDRCGCENAMHRCHRCGSVVTPFKVCSSCQQKKVDEGEENFGNPGPSDAEMAQADYEAQMDDKTEYEASKSAQAESDVQAEYESSLHKDCLDKSRVKQAIND